MPAFLQLNTSPQKQIPTAFFQCWKEDVCEAASVLGKEERAAQYYS